MANPINEAVTKSFPSVFQNGLLIDDSVTVVIGKIATVYDAWKEIKIQRSMEQVSSSFIISLADKWRETNDLWPLKPGAPIAIKIGKENVLNGYIDTMNVDIKNDDRTVEISGRDLTGDLVDSSAFTSPGTYKNIKVDALAKKFATDIFGIKVTAEVDVGDSFKKFTVKQGETVFEMLERAAKLRGLLLISDNDGNLIITNRSGGNADVSSGSTTAPSLKNLVAQTSFTVTAASESSTVALIQGENIIEAKASYDYSDRFQTYLVKGQAVSSDTFNGKKNTSVSAVARDLTIERSRTKIIIADGTVDKSSAQKRANWEAIVRASKAVDVIVKVQGWKQTQGGKLWKPNILVSLEAGFIGLQGIKLLVTSVQFTKSIDEGTVTMLKLTRPDAYIPEQKTLEKKDDPTEELGWKAQVFKILGN